MITIFKHLYETEICIFCDKEIQILTDAFIHNCGFNGVYHDTINVDQDRYELVVRDNLLILSDRKINFTAIYLVNKSDYKLQINLDYFHDVQYPFLENINLFVDRVLKMKVFE